MLLTNDPQCAEVRWRSVVWRCGVGDGGVVNESEDVADRALSSVEIVMQCHPEP